jgi:hypothetical protein
MNSARETQLRSRSATTSCQTTHQLEIVQAIEAADEFFSACSSDISDDNEIFCYVSPPYEPLVGS